VEDGGEVTREHCLVRNSRGLCMCVSGEGSAVTAKMCKFVEGAAGGLLFENGGGGFVSECDIAGEACRWVSEAFRWVSEVVARS